MKKIITIEKSIKAIKNHKCNYCLQLIEKGSFYNRSTHVFEGNIYDWKSHIHCSEIASKLNMHDYADQGVTSDQFIETIQDEYLEIISRTQEQLYENEYFIYPKFAEQLRFVLDYYKIEII